MEGKEQREMMELLKRAERLNRLLGSEKGGEAETKRNDSHEAETSFENTRGENMLMAAIPFLDKEYQKNIFVMVRLLEMMRVAGGAGLAAREKQEPADIRRQKMLQAVRPFLMPQERGQVDSIIKIMNMKRLMEKREVFYGDGMG